jgi:hypothetical protein
MLHALAGELLANFRQKYFACLTIVGKYPHFNQRMRGERVVNFMQHRRR